MISVEKLSDVAEIIFSSAQSVEMIIEIPHVETTSFYRPHLIF